MSERYKNALSRHVIKKNIQVKPEGRPITDFEPPLPCTVVDKYLKDKKESDLLLEGYNKNEMHRKIYCESLVRLYASPEKLSVTLCGVIKLAKDLADEAVKQYKPFIHG